MAAIVTCSDVAVCVEADAPLLDELQRAMEATGVKVRRRPPRQLYATSQESLMVLVERTERWLRKKGCVVKSEKG